MARLSGVSPEDLPPVARDAASRLRQALLAILGDALVAMWVHGGTTFSNGSTQPGDLDVVVVLSGLAEPERSPRVWRRDPASRPSRIAAAETVVTEAAGLEIDGTYLLAAEIGRGRLPSVAFAKRRRVNDWAIQRAHWLAGRYALLLGPPPDELVLAPTRREIRWALDRELEHLERHVAEGDAADPTEAAYAVLNGCRILRTLDTGDAVISKRSAGDWGLEHLAPRWHPAVLAAGRVRDATAGADDPAVLAAETGAFVRMVRCRLPHRGTRPSATPRWS